MGSESMFSWTWHCSFVTKVSIGILGSALIRKDNRKASNSGRLSKSAIYMHEGPMRGNGSRVPRTYFSSFSYQKASFLVPTGQCRLKVSELDQLFIRSVPRLPLGDTKLKFNDTLEVL